VSTDAAHPGAATTTDLDEHELFVAGRWVKPAASCATAPVSNSADGSVLATVVQGGRHHVDDAVAAARSALPAMAALGVSERVAALTALADALEGATGDIARTISLEVGTPIRLSEAIQVGLPVQVLRAYAKALQDMGEERIGHSLLVRQPAGVVGAITPWNYPLHQAVAKLGAAIAAGCPLVLKPSNEAPLSVFALARLMAEVGLPEGALSVIPGSGLVVGEAIASHPDISVVSFTGSTGAGMRVAEVAARNITRVTLELGGKSASIVLDDADLDTAVKASVRSAFLNSGQTCSAWTRLVVPRHLLDEVTERAAVETARLTLGHPHDNTTRLGPLVSAAQQRAVQRYIDEGRREGLKLAAGAGTLDRGGYYVDPTIFTDVPAESPLAREEIFGPVLCILAVRDQDEAVDLSNRSHYGLSGAVWSADPERALAVARRLRTGQVDINGAPFNPAAPFGGYGHSGIGRELGRFGIEEFLQTTSIQLPGVPAQG
jgi:acyl-CoA reductase-like NAD-dependent aldehyde dehydrogenase